MRKRTNVFGIDYDEFSPEDVAMVVTQGDEVIESRPLDLGEGRVLPRYIVTKDSPPDITLELPYANTRVRVVHNEMEVQKEFSGKYKGEKIVIQGTDLEETVEVGDFSGIAGRLVIYFHPSPGGEATAYRDAARVNLREFFVSLTAQAGVALGVPGGSFVRADEVATEAIASFLESMQNDIWMGNMIISYSDSRKADLMDEIVHEKEMAEAATRTGLILPGSKGFSLIR